MLAIKVGRVKRVIESILGDKYSVSFYVKDTADFGVPQHRRRVLIIGNRIGCQNPELQSTHSDHDTSMKPYVTVHEAISELPSILHNSGKEFMKYRQTRKLLDYAAERRNGSDRSECMPALIVNPYLYSKFIILRAGRLDKRCQLAEIRTNSII